MTNSIDAMEIETMTAGYTAGKKLAAEMMVVGQLFTGSMPVADKCGERGTLVWEAAHCGARLVISQFKDIFTDTTTGRITALI